MKIEPGFILLPQVKVVAADPTSPTATCLRMIQMKSHLRS